MTFRLSLASMSKLVGVHPDLAAIVTRAIAQSPIDFMVIEGVRTKERQAQLKAAGASQTLHSRHLTGHAVDLGALVGGELRWDWPLYHQIADVMKKTANGMNIPIEWGGDWTSFPDGPHFQLPWSKYP